MKKNTLKYIIDALLFLSWIVVKFQLSMFCGFIKHMKFFKYGLCLILFIFSACSSQSSSNFIEDRAGLLKEDARLRMAQYHRVLLEDLDIHFKLVILEKSPSSMDVAANELFSAYALGSQTRGAKGVLFLVDPNGSEVRIEIGYDLEPVFPDSFVGYVERNQMAPFFSSGKVGEGVEATVELMVTRAQRESGGFEFDSQEELGVDDEFFSGGAGAKSNMEIGTTLLPKEESRLADEFGAQPSPEQALAAYKRVLRLYIKDPNLRLYTPESRKFFSQWVVTDAQQSNELDHLESAKSSRIFIEGVRAVIRFPLEDRTHNPFFFRQGPDGWMLDFAAMHQTIIFNHKNYWHFKVKDHPYMFGFKDLLFDKNGFPFMR